jgi:hypothetical protein
MKFNDLSSMADVLGFAVLCPTYGPNVELRDRPLLACPS